MFSTFLQNDWRTAHISHFLAPQIKGSHCFFLANMKTNLYNINTFPPVRVHLYSYTLFTCPVKGKNTYFFYSCKFPPYRCFRHFPNNISQPVTNLIVVINQINLPVYNLPVYNLPVYNLPVLQLFHYLAFDFLLVCLVICLNW